MDFLKFSLKELSSSIRQGQFSVVEVCQFYLDRISKINPELNAFITTNPEALKRAQELDALSEKKGKLFGVPVAVKDNFCTTGLETTVASKILHGFVPPYSAHCVELLEKEGAVVIGKTNLDEFAMGSSNENSAKGACKNPWDLNRVPGGSSGGSAACQAARLACFSLGTDTGGSIRQPASFCGVVGVKPTYGSISRYGMVAFASSLDQAGPLANSVEDAALALDVMIGFDEKDGTNVKRQQSSFEDLKPMELKGKKIGLPKEYFSGGLDAGTKRELDNTVKILTSQGCEMLEVTLPHSEFAIPVYYLVAASEASSNLARYDGVRYGLRETLNDEGQTITDLAEFYKATRTKGFGEEVKRRIMLGTFALSSGYYDAYYTKACQVRQLIAQDFFKAFNECDFIIGPVTTSGAFNLGEKVDDPISMYYNDVFTTPVNLAGLPAMSLPIGLDNNNVPVGLQIIAPHFKDKEMLSFAWSVENCVDFQEVPRAF